MTYVVTENCIKCKYMDCIEVCPVECFYEGENMIAIDPEQCIHCGVCEPQCPIQAIVPDTVPGAERWVEINQKYASLWPHVTKKGISPIDADQWREVPHKFEAYFSPKPGKGDEKKA